MTRNPSESERCHGCSRGIARAAAFSISGQNLCFRCAVAHRPLLGRSARTAAVVGTVLVAINLGRPILAGEFPADAFWKIPLNYLVPFCVATWGALSNSRSGRG